MKNNNFNTKKIDDIDYISVGDSADNQYSIFSTLNFLNRNTDLYKLTKNTVPTIIKLTNSPEVVKELIEKTNSTSYDNLVERVKKAFVKPDDNILVNNLAKDVKNFIILAKKQKLSLEKITTYEKGVTKSPLLNYENSTSNLVKNVTYVYGENRYFEADKKVKIGQMLPLKTNFESEKEGVEQLDKINKYVKNVYNYNIQTSSEKIGKVKKDTLFVPNYASKMDNAVGVLYNVSKNLVGSKNLELKDAQQIVDKNEPNVFLNSTTIKNNLRKQVFKEHKEEILDVVNTLTTIFMSRFVFDSKYFSKIERDLSEQACVKMQNLVISNNEDYWINELIQDRVKLNCSQVLASNNIKNAKQLADVYSKNGTKIVNPENIVTLDDMIFSLQYSEETEVETPELANASAGLSENVKANAKNKGKGKAKKQGEEKVAEAQKEVHPIKKVDESNAYLKAIRETDVYKKYLEKYQELLKLTRTPKAKKPEKLSDILMDILDKLDTVKENTDDNILRLENLTQDGKLLEENETSKKELKEIKHDSKHNLDVLNFVAKNDNLPDEITDRIADETARNDTVILKCNELLNEEVETEEVETEEESKPVNSENKDEQSPSVDAEKQVSQEDVNPLQENIIDGNQISIDEYLNEMKKQTFSTQRYVKTTLKNNEEKLKKQFRKYYSNIINGTTTKQGLVESVLNYRVIEKKTTKNNASTSDVERLDDKDFKKANVVRDNVIEDIVELLSDNAVRYVKDNFDEIDDKATVEKIGAKSVGDTLEYPKDKNFDRKKLKKVLAVMITNKANEELKDLNVELYTGKRTFKEVNSIITKNANAEDGEEK